MNENETGIQEYRDKSPREYPTPGSLSSEADHLSTAVEAQEAPESAHGPEAQRADAAWDTFPADSSASVDYPVKSEDLAEVRPLTLQAPVLEAPVFNSYAQLEAYVPEPALNVDVVVRLPNGKAWSLNLVIPDPEQTLGNSEILREISAHFDAASAMLAGALPIDSRRAVLGLDES